MSIETDKDKFLRALSTGLSIGNTAHRRNLNWQEARYWKIHALLLADGKITVGRGRGGSVARAKVRKTA